MVFFARGNYNPSVSQGNLTTWLNGRSINAYKMAVSVYIHQSQLRFLG